MGSVRAIAEREARAPRRGRASRCILLVLWLASCGGEPPPPPKAPPRAPPAKVAEEPELKPGLNHHQLRKVMNDTADPAVRGCYTVAYSGKDGGTGQLVVDFSVNPDGTVASATVSDSTLANPTLEDCVQKVYEGLTFPRAPGATDASRPYNFKNGQNQASAAPDP